jgi:hypothetical protein
MSTEKTGEYWLHQLPARPATDHSCCQATVDLAIGQQPLNSTADGGRIDQEVRFPNTFDRVEVPPIHGRGNFKVMLQQAVVGNLSEAGQHSKWCANFNGHCTRPAEHQVRQAGPMWTDHTLGPVKEVDLLGQRQPFQPDRLESQRCQCSQQLVLIHNRPAAPPASHDQQPGIGWSVSRQMPGESPMQKLARFGAELLITQGRDEQAIRLEMGLRLGRNDSLSRNTQQPQRLSLEWLVDRNIEPGVFCNTSLLIKPQASQIADKPVVIVLTGEAGEYC